MKSKSKTHKTMNRRIDRKIQKLIDKVTYLDIDFDDFLKKYVTPKLITEEGKELSFKLKKSHQIGRYFVCTGIEGSCVVGEVLRDWPLYIPFSRLSIWEKERLIYVLKEEGFFDE